MTISTLDEVNIQDLYGSANRKDLPHVIKFSGGRSSGMLLKLFLDNDLLCAKRGDVVIFNNTSAEHPATYEFTRKCAEYAEDKYGIPFFWIEFATYEDAHGGEWTRSPTFKLVNRSPYSASNPLGYHQDGEVFEELVSYQGFLPSRTTRTCTAHLKLEITSRFLSEWFSTSAKTLRRGHFHPTSKITDDSIYLRHQRNRGRFSREALLAQREFVRNRPFVRESQYFHEFTQAKLVHRDNTDLKEKSLGDYASTSGPNAIQFLSLIGLRNDERSRVYRVLARNNDAEDGRSRKATYMLNGEIIMTPLSKLKISKDDVLEYWSNQSWDLSLPNDANLSNCTFCFNKGSAELSRIFRRMSEVDASLPLNLRSRRDSPTDINWWVDLERRYLRVARKRDGNTEQETVKIGMWGVDSETSYTTIRDSDPDELIAKEPASALPCDCTE